MDAVFIDLPVSPEKPVEISDYRTTRNNWIPGLLLSSGEEKLLVYPQPELRRCTRVPVTRDDAVHLLRYEGRVQLLPSL